MKLLRELFPGVGVPASRVVVYTVAILVMTAGLRPDLFRYGTESTLEGHSILSLDLAMSRAFCGTPSAVSPLVSVTSTVRDQPELSRVPARLIAAERSGTLERFCETSTAERINNENSLMWLTSWIWRAQPEASVYRMGQLLHAIRVAGLAVAVALFMSLGLGVIVAGASLIWLLMLLHDLRLYVHSTYPFLPILIVVTAAVYAKVAVSAWARSSLGAVVTALVSGAWSAFAVNMRTSHLPIYLFFAIVLFYVGERAATQPGRPTRWRRTALALALFVAGYAGFQYVAITRHLPTTTQTFARHTIAHPLVLALGVPPSDFSRSQGIDWSDSVGLSIALRVDPAAQYLEPSYERALFHYYKGLWSTYPREMVRVYVYKAKTAGKHMLMIVRWREGGEGRVIRPLLATLDLLPNGIYLLALFGLLTVGALVYATPASGGAVALALLSAAAVLIQLEASAIMSQYVINYQAYMAFFCVFISVAAPAWVIGRVWDFLMPRSARE